METSHSFEVQLTSILCVTDTNVLLVCSVILIQSQTYEGAAAEYE